MHLAAPQLASHLQKGLRNLYTLHGDEVLLAQEAADAIRAQARANGFTERSVFTVAGAHFDWSAVQASAGALSLFGDQQVIELRIPSGKPGKEGAMVLQQLAANAARNDGVLLMLILPRIDKATKSTAWFEALEQNGVSMQFDPVERQALPQWLAQRLALQQQRVAPGDEGVRCLQFFADRVEGNLLAAHQEIQKLSLLYPAGELSLAQVEASVLDVARFNVFKLGEAVLAGQLLRVQRMLEGLQAEGTAAVLVHHTLAEDIRGLKRVKDAMQAGRPLPLALRDNRVWGIKERLYERALPKLSSVRLDRLLWAAHQVDGVVKGIVAPQWPHHPWQALLRLATLLTRSCMPR